MPAAAPGGVPGGPPPLPPSLTAGPPGTGGMAGPQGNPGNTMAAVAKIRTALILIQTALPAIPMGSDFHSDVLKTVGMLAKHIPDSASVGADQQQIQQLRMTIQQMAQQQPNAQLAQLAQPPANAPPAMAPPPPTIPVSPAGPPGGAPPEAD
jgi:hypothetical protein